MSDAPLSESPTDAFRQAVERRDFAAARDAFAQCDPGQLAQDSAHLRKLALGLFAGGQYADSLPVFAACLENGGSDTATALRYAQACAVSGQEDRAGEIAEKILEHKPGHPDALLLRAECFAVGCGAEQVDEAAGLFEAAQRALPPDAGRNRPLLQLVRLLFNHERLEQAIVAARDAIRIAPDDAVAHSELAKCLSKLNRLAESRHHREVSLLSQPENAEWLTHYGNVLFRLGDAIGARTVCQLAERIQPDQPRTLYELANIAYRCEQLDVAIPLMDRSITALGTYRAKSAFARSLMDLMAGRFEVGWRGYEHRLGCIPIKLADPALHRWEGEPLRGTLLIHTEQGLGDTLMLSRFFPKVRALAGPGARLVLVVENSARRLMESSFAGVIDEFTATPVPFARQIATGSLPLVLGVKTESDLAAPARYLTPPQRPSIRLRGGKGKFNVGICWFGNPLHLDQVYRIIPLERVMPIFAIDGVQFHALHIGEACDAIRRHGLPANLSLYDERITDLADTAGLIDQCDCVVSVDTSGIHLTGALGKPALLLLPRGSEFRWMLDRSDSPWYSTVEILRQRHFHDWVPVIEAAKRWIGRAMAGR